MRLAEWKLAMTALGTLASADAADITGTGSTFVCPILSKWSADHSAVGGTKVERPGSRVLSYTMPD
jgi:ABC-type phosphate transport system substrate-binding protein